MHVPPPGVRGLLQKRKRDTLDVAQLMLQPALPLPEGLKDMWINTLMRHKHKLNPAGPKK